MSVLTDPNTALDAVVSLPHLVRTLSLSIDDSSISVLGMLVGIVGGWTLTSLHQQMKAKRVKLASRRRQAQIRKTQ